MQAVFLGGSRSIKTRRIRYWRDVQVKWKIEKTEQAGGTVDRWWQRLSGPCRVAERVLLCPEGFGSGGRVP